LEASNSTELAQSDALEDAGASFRGGKATVRLIFSTPTREAHRCLEAIERPLTRQAPLVDEAVMMTVVAPLVLATESARHRVLDARDGIVVDHRYAGDVPAGSIEERAFLFAARGPKLRQHVSRTSTSSGSDRSLVRTEECP